MGLTRQRKEPRAPSILKSAINLSVIRRADLEPTVNLHQIISSKLYGKLRVICPFVGGGHQSDACIQLTSVLDLGAHSKVHGARETFANAISSL
jgi:hypothetical protein